MLNQISKVAGIGLATTVSGIFVFGFIPEAKAVTFTTNLGSSSLAGGESANLGSRTISATGVLTDVTASFDYNEPVSSSNWASDLLVQINDDNGNSINVGGDSTTPRVPWENGGSVTTVSGSYALTTPDFSSLVTSNGASDWTFSIVNDFGSGNVSEYNNLVLDLELNPTPVPFGVSPNMGILILGGLYGASRLCKTIKART